MLTGFSNLTSVIVILLFLLKPSLLITFDLMLFSLKFIKRTQKPFYFFNTIEPFKAFPFISTSWLKRTSLKINQGTFVYRKISLKRYNNTTQFKNRIIEISFVILLKIIRIKKNNLSLYHNMYESLRFSCN